MNHFNSAETTDYVIGHQKGANVKISTQGGEVEIKAWVDFDDAYNLRVDIEGHDDLGLIIAVDKTDHILPTITYSDDKTYCYVTFNTNALHIKIEAEGLVLDVWDSKDDENGSLGSTYIYFHEIVELEDA